MVVVLLGPPGVGKGTQGALLADSLGWERIATGDVLRTARREGTELGRQAQAYMDAGDLVPDDLIVAMVGQRLEEIPVDRGVVFDGFPRTVPQAHELEAMLPKLGRQVDGVVLLEASPEVLVKRLSGRRSCPQCGRVFNVHYDPPVEDGICDECGAMLVHRRDDEPETVRRRLDVYEAQTEPLVDHYENGPSPVLRINGEGALEDVRMAVTGALAQHLDVKA